MIEVLETDGLLSQGVGEREVTPLPSTTINVDELEDDKDTEYPEHFDGNDRSSKESSTSVMYTVDSTEDVAINIDTEFCSDEDDTDLLSPTSSSKNKPNYHRHPKPPFSYIALIAMAIKDSSTGKLTLAEINEYLMKRFPFFRGSYTGWRNSVRHNLSLNECFIKILRDPSRPWGKDNYWTINENSEYTFADGVFRRRRKRINRSRKKANRKSHLHGVERFDGHRRHHHHQQQQQQQRPTKGKFTGPFSIDSILGKTDATKDEENIEDHFDIDSNPNSPPESYHYFDQRVPAIISPQDSILDPPTKSRLIPPPTVDFKTFRAHIPPSSSATIGHLQQRYGLTNRSFELETLQYQSRVKSDASSTVFAGGILATTPIESLSGEHRVRLPWGRPMMPTRIPAGVCFAPVAKRSVPHVGFLVENLISR
ncbi:uncharacterized protein [Amphiura filiformis]|uniref:uncharacterized protein n=1 Tax=Amphiura filiformis TaxID=82378 RepID=UPI003B214AE8